MEPNREASQAALKTLYLAYSQASLDSASNPYGNCGSSEESAKVLAEYPLENIRKKQFNNLSANDFS